MTDRRIVDDVLRLLGDPGELAERLTKPDLENLPGPPEGGAPDPATAAMRQERDRVVGDGISGLLKMAGGRTDDLDDDELFGLEAIVALEGRPAILIQGGDFLPPPQNWAHLTRARAEIREAIARSGRVEVTGHVEHEWVGTASLVGPATIMTNRHVAQEFCAEPRRGHLRRGRRSRGSWTFRPGMTSRIDFLKEWGSSASSMEFDVTGVIGIHEDRDLALLRVESTSSEGRALPDPLTVASRAPADIRGRELYVVGYPAWDGRRNEPEAMRRIFNDVYDCKRLQPGRAVRYSDTYSALEYDCSTLGGNSGSPVFDLATHQVIGLHFGGTYGRGNYAVAMWTLTDDPLLAEGGVNFH
jgi:hypothetical protein